MEALAKGNENMKSMTAIAMIELWPAQKRAGCDGQRRSMAFTS